MSSARLCSRGVLVALALAVPSWATTIRVPADRPTIQAAVDAAAPGDHVVVAPGQYQESVKVHNGQTGLVVEAADPANPPVILGFPYDSSDGFRVDDVDGVVIRNFVILDAYDGVRLNNVDNGVLANLRIERNALGIRVNRGSANVVAGCTVLDTRVEQGILIDNSDGSVLWANVVRGGTNEAIRVSGADCVVAVGNTVSDSYGNGIEVDNADAIVIEGSNASNTNRVGIHISNSNFLRLVNNVANGNGNVGFLVDKSWPLATVADLIADGNQASGNPSGNFVVHERRTQPDGPPACTSRTTTSTLPPGTTTSTVPPTTTTTRPSTTSTVPPTTTSTIPPTTTTTRPTTSSTVVTTTSTVRPTTTSTTLQPPLLTPVRFRFYVRYARTVGSDLNANVPKRSIDAPLTVSVSTAHVSAFAPGKRRTEQELAALGGDTLARLRAAAGAHLQANPASYPGYAGLLEIKWAAGQP